MATPQFGWRPEIAAVQVPKVCAALDAKGHPHRFRSAAPGLAGTGEGKTVILHEAAKKVPGLNGAFLKSQHQPRGTCTSRGAKRIVDVTQCVLIANGEPLNFAYTSHAVLYGAGREHAGMLGGDPNDANDDGCDGASMAWAASTVGLLRNTDDTDDDNDDHLACLWGARGVPADVKAKAHDHLIKRVALARTPEEVRDAVTNGYGVTVASNIGFEGIRSSNVFGRDSEGRAHRGGTWNHQMCITGYRADKNWFLWDQSWGPNCPDGPLGDLPIPSYSFWASWDDSAAAIHQNDTWIYSGIDGWLADLMSWYA